MELPVPFLPKQELIFLVHISRIISGNYANWPGSFLKIQTTFIMDTFEPYVLVVF